MKDIIDNLDFSIMIYESKMKEIHKYYNQAISELNNDMQDVLNQIKYAKKEEDQKKRVNEL